MEWEQQALERAVRKAAEGLGGDRLAPVGSGWLADRLAEWSAEYGLCSSGAGAEAARRIRVAELAASAFEPAGDVAPELGGQLVLWLFLFDDAFGEGDRFADSKEHFAALDPFRQIALGVGKASSNCGFQRSLADWLAESGGLANADWSYRFGLDLCGYFNGCLEELPVRRCGRPVPVFRYRELRAATVGTRPVFAVAELGTGPLTLKETLGADFVELRKRAALLTAWVNDLYSFPKEHAAGDPLNLVQAIAHRDRLPPQVAIEVVVRLYNDELRQFEALARAVAQASESAGRRRYVAALRHWVHANRWWTQHCGRYLSDERAPAEPARRPVCGVASGFRR